MATNLKRRDGWHLSLPVTDPATPASGDPVRIGNMTGVAQTAKGDGGNAAANTSVDLGPSVWNVSVKGVNDSGNSAVAVGDAIFYVDADTPKLSKKSSGFFWGIALETVGSGSTATIQVLHMPTAASPLGAGSVAQNNIAPNALDATVAANVPNAAAVGGLTVLFRIDIADAATGDVDVTPLTHKVRVVVAWAVKTSANAAAANTVQVKNGTNAITDAMSININDQAIVRAASIDDAQHEIAAGGTLRVTRTKAGGNAACIVYVLGIRVP
jgi:hypothetical protein